MNSVSFSVLILLGRNMILRGQQTDLRCSGGLAAIRGKKGGDGDLKHGKALDFVHFKTDFLNFSCTD